MNNKDWRFSPQSRFRNRKNKSEGGIPCPFCNFYCLSMGSHFFYAHNLKARDYKIQNDLQIKTRLTADSYHYRQSEHGKRYLHPIPSKGRPRGGRGYLCSIDRASRKEKIKLLKKFLILGRNTKSAYKAIETKKKNGYKWPSPSKETRNKISMSLKKFHAGAAVAGGGKGRKEIDANYVDF